MNFAFTEEQAALRDAARDFLADQSGSEQVRAAMASDLGYDPALWKRIAGELGWPSLVVPEAYGGLGLGAVELVALMEAMGETLLCSPYFATVALAAQALLVAGSEEQKQRILGPLAAGELRAALAVPERGAEGAGLSVQRDGSDFRLDGTLRGVVDGHSADWLVVAAEADSGTSLFALPGDTPGLARRALPTMDQTRRQAEVVFEAVTLGADALLGHEGEGAGPLSRALDLATIALAAEQVGGAQRCLDLAVAYAREREQFGRPIGSFQAIKHLCADMMVRVETARSAVYYAGCVAAEGGPELATAASLAKAYCSEAYFHCAGECIQIHGGVGFTWEYDPHLYFKRARASEAMLGTPSWHRERVAQAIGL